MGKVTTLQWDITNEGQEVSPFPTGKQTDVHESITKQDRNNINQVNISPVVNIIHFTVLPAKSDSDAMFCLQIY